MMSFRSIRGRGGTLTQGGPMKPHALDGAPLYDYQRQEWAAIHPSTDREIRRGIYKTPAGLMYHIDPLRPGQYMNRGNGAPYTPQP